MKARYRPIAEDAGGGPARPAVLTAALAMFVSSILIFMATLCIALLRPCTALSAWEMLNVPSPITKNLNLDQPLGTLLRGELGQPDDIWSLTPSPEVDRAWRELNRANQAWVTAEELIAAGKNISVSVKSPKSTRYGNDAYPVLVDIKHQMHCLNRIRKDLHHNFDYYWKETYPEGKTTGLHQAHTNHCVSILLQALKCAATTDLIAYAWYEGYDHPHPDFNIERKCGDFEGIQEWTRSRRVRDFSREVFNTEKPEDQATLTMTPEGLRVLSLFDG